MSDTACRTEQPCLRKRRETVGHNVQESRFAFGRTRRRLHISQAQIYMGA